MNISMLNLIKPIMLIAAFSCVFSAKINAQDDTMAMQFSLFSQLPENQQQALIKQYSLARQNSLNQNASLPAVKPIKPRDVAVDRKKIAKNSLTPHQLSRFGLALFSGSPSTFMPLENVPVPTNYVIGPNDEIVIQTYGKDNDEYRLRVQRDGNIYFPTLGAMNVIGMNFSQMREFLTKRIETQMIGVKSNISLGELRSMQIFVLGDAFKPGSYSVNALTTISQAVYLSGGFSENGSLRNVQLKRNGKLIRTLDMYDLLLKGDTKNDLRLQPGDAVFIGSVGRTVSVYGEVNRPAIYELKANEKLSTVIAMAGGLTPNALLENIRINRKSAQGLAKIISVNFTRAEGKAAKINNGDEIHLLTRSNHLQNYVQIEGDVVNPGQIEWRAGLRLSDVFVSIDAAFYDSTDLTYALVLRKQASRQNIKLLQVNLENALKYKGSKEDIPLNSEDKIMIFSRFELAENTSISSKQAKTLEQALQQSAKDEERTSQLLAGKLNFSAKQLEIISRNSDISQAQIERIKRTSRRVLLAPLLQQLEQQASVDTPAAIVEIVGEVKSPGRYPLVEGAKIADLIRAAGGLTANAYTRNAELARSFTHSNQEVNTRTLNIDLAAAVKGLSHYNAGLMPRDKINILTKPGANSLNATVVLEGEVRFPGTYTVSQGETLGELIARAGGLTRFANAQAAIFTREILRLQEEKLLNNYAQDIRKETVKKVLSVSSSNIASLMSDPEKTLSLIEEATKSKALGRMVVQLNDIIAKKSATDFMLEDGDFLFIPRFKNTVSVMGEVQVAVTYILDDSLSVDEYIEKAGGLKKQADEDRIFVIRADGSVFTPEKNYWFSKKTQKLKAGDTIIVPLDTNYRDPLSLWESATKILYQTGVAVNALR